jgi:hypothetical protein
MARHTDQSQDMVFGAAAGLGWGPFMTSAANPSELAGPFENVNISLGFGSLVLSFTDSGIWAISATGWMPGKGGAVSSYPTYSYPVVNSYDPGH